MSLIVVITNDGTGTEKIGRYNYEVRINSEVIARGRIERHNRASGWHRLLEQVAHHGRDAGYRQLKRLCDAMELWRRDGRGDDEPSDHRG